MCTLESHDAVKASREDFMAATRAIGDTGSQIFDGLLIRNCRHCGSTLAIAVEVAGELNSSAGQDQG